jgi:cell wall assembly regulator SMI1
MSARIEEVWGEYVAFLAVQAPGAFANLAPGADEAQLAELERDVHQRLPQELSALLRLNDGQIRLGRSYVFPGLQFLSCRRISEEWQSWARFREGETEAGLGMLDSHAAALDLGVRDVYTHPGWLPLLKLGDRADYLGVDLAPSEGGKLGQIINFGRDEDQHFIACASLLELLEFWLAELPSSCKGRSLKLDKSSGLSMLRNAASARRGA